MGQIFSLRKTSSVRSDSKRRLEKRKSKSATTVPTVDYCKVDGDQSRLPKEHHHLSSSGQAEWKGTTVTGCSSKTSDLFQRDNNNNNCHSGVKHLHVSSSDNKDVNNMREGRPGCLADGRREGVSKKAFNDTYSIDGGCNHSSPKNSLRTKSCHYLDSSAKSVYSEATTVQSEPARRHHNHRHNRRRKSKSAATGQQKKNKSDSHQHFGYEIRNVEEFLEQCSLLSPGNIPVVLSTASILYQTRPGFQLEIPLPLGMVVNGVFKINQWIYVQTPHCEEGYLTYDSCLPLGILPTAKPPTMRSKPERCWETTDDIYPKPGGVESDYYRARSEGARTPNCSEKNVDSLYLRVASSHSNLDRTYSQVKRRSEGENDVVSSTKSTNTPSGSSLLVRETLLAVQINYKSSAIAVKKGDVVTLLACKEIRDSFAKTPRQWFYIRTRNGNEAFIPAEVAGHGFL